MHGTSVGKTASSAFDGRCRPVLGVHVSGRMCRLIDASEKMLSKKMMFFATAGMPVQGPILDSGFRTTQSLRRGVPQTAKHYFIRPVACSPTAGRRELQVANQTVIFAPALHPHQQATSYDELSQNGCSINASPN